ncbi:MAG: DUF378 domain-containing protein [Candidatus Falkowbacteria bacterium]|nr:DUF378 domain-containing protein [Candidatus Falkowbacteria bacterium]
MKKFNALDLVALFLVVIGGLNWALVGLGDFDLVAAIFGPMTFLTRVVYSVVGLAALYVLSIIARSTKK